MSAPLTQPTYVRPSAFEIAVGYVHGLLPGTPMPTGDRDPIRALEGAIRGGLTAAPCYVTFSGGRDSSAVLAVATRLARREGLPDPVPVTEVYPGVAETEESEWQRLVIEHLGLSDWVRVNLAEENDMVGRVATAGLLRRGVVWPPALQVKSTVLRTLGGGSVLTGEGGDEVLGAHRITPAVRFAKQWRRAGVARGVLLSAFACAPRPVRRHLLRRQVDAAAGQSWLLPAARRRHLDLVAADLATEPLHWGESVWWLRRRRAAVAASANHAQLAAEHGLKLTDPLLDPGFLAAIAAFGGRWGFAGRTEMMRLLFGDVLPARVLERWSKARFNKAYAGQETLAFAQRWDGSGVDQELVRPDLLREEWLSANPSALTFMLLQQAWLASLGRSSNGQLNV